MSTQRPNYQVIQTRTGPKVVDVNAPAASAGPPASENRFWAMAQLMRLDRPVGILLLLWPTLCALFLAAKGLPSLSLLVIFALGVVLTRSAGCVINDYADRWLDGQVERTKARPLARGALSGRAALVLFCVLMLAALALVSLTNRSTVLLAVGALLITVLYPYCKRYTYYPQAVLGAAFSMGIPMAFSASEQALGAQVWLLFCGNFLWTLAYDTLYGMVDRDDDLRMGARSTAILFGEMDIAAVAILHGCALLSFLCLGLRAALHWPFYLALAVCALLMAWQIKAALARTREHYFFAFKLNQWVGLALFFGVWGGL